MKKSTFQKLFLMLLPIGAVALATTPDSVRVLNTLTGEAAGYSYFSLVEGIPFQMAAPMAAILSLVSGILAAVYLGAKKTGCLKGISVTAFLASCFGVLPILFRGEILVVPNVLLPIMMVAEAVLAWYMKKKPVEEGEKAPRLGPHL